MKIASIVVNEKETGDQILILSRTEAQDMINVFTEYCSEHKKKTNAKKFLKQIENNMQVW